VSILSIFKKVKTAVSAAFIKVFGSDAAHQFAAGAAALLKTSAGLLAQDAVKYALSLKLGTSSDLRYAAANKLSTDARAQGIVLPNSLVNMLIEVAVQAVVKQNIQIA
jgi:hypothetical protein